MRFLFIFIILLSVSVSSFAQRKKKNTDIKDDKTQTETLTKPITQDSLYLTIFRTGMKYGDYQVAVNALYHMLALHPENTSLKDSLVLLYNGMGNSVQAVIIAREILQKNTDNIPVLNAMAESEQRLGLYKEALESYELLYDKKQRLYDFYQVASIQFAMKRYAEAQNTLAAIIRNPKSMSDKLTITAADNSSQDVPFKAAAYNLLGVLALEMKDYDEAQSNFKKAIEIAPDFYLAQNNLQILTTEMSKQKNQDTKTKNTTKTPVKK